MRRVVAIDGPSGAGKSTIAKGLAHELGFSYLDTGALYRAIALGLSNSGVREDSPDTEISNALGQMNVSYKDGRVSLNGQDVEDEIRKPEIGHLSSVFSARAPVRAFLLPAQKQAALVDDIVAEGRDMTTVVFPEAMVKVYLDATVEARAKRRFDQLSQMGIEADMDSAIRDVSERDKRDSSRDIAPLARADDSLYIDSSDLPVDQVMAMIRSAVEACV